MLKNFMVPKSKNFFPDVGRKFKRAGKGKSSYKGVIGICFLSFFIATISTSLIFNTFQGAHAASTDYINFQGKLTDQNGYGVVSQTRSVTFCIFSATSGGSCAASPSGQLWYETKNVTTDARGIFNTPLGSTTAFGSTLFTANSDLYLGINIAGDGEMTPRHPIGTVPSSLNSQALQGNTWAAPGAIGNTTANSGKFTTLSATGQLTSTVAIGTSPFSITSTTMNSNLNADLLDGSHSTAFAPASGSGNYVQLQASTPGSAQTGHFNISGTGIVSTVIGGTAANNTLTLQGNSATSGNTLTNAAIQLKVGDSGAATAMTILNNGNIGIGTTSPTSKLDVSGDIYVSSTNVFSGRASTMSFFNPTHTAVLEGQKSLDLASWSGGPSQGGTGAITFSPLNVEKVRIDNAGNVGIGIAAPLNKLHILGTSQFTLGLESPSYPELRFIVSGNTKQQLASVTGAGGFFAGSGVNDFAFYSTGSGNWLFGNASGEYFRITNAGNVGIGVASPTEALDVNGRLKLAKTTAPSTVTDKLYNVSSNLYWNGSIIDSTNVTSSIANNFVPNSRFIDGQTSWTGWSGSSAAIVDSTVNTQTSLNIDTWDESAWTTGNQYAWITDTQIDFSDTYLIGKYVVFTGSPTSALTNYNMKIVATDQVAKKIQVFLPVGWQNAKGYPAIPTTGEAYSIAAIASRSTKTAKCEHLFNGCINSDYFVVPGNQALSGSYNVFVMNSPSNKNFYLQMEVTDTNGKFVYRWTSMTTIAGNTNNWIVANFGPVGPFADTANWVGAEVGAKVTPTFLARIILKPYDDTNVSHVYVTGIQLNGGNLAYAYNPHYLETEDANARLVNNLSVGGNVAIGGITPTTTGRLQITDTTTTANYSGLRVDQSGAVSGTGYSGYFAKTGASTTNVGLYSTATGATNNYAAIFESGNVGIGTTTPGTKLNVVGGSVLIGTTTLAGSVFSFQNGDGSGDNRALFTNNSLYSIAVSSGARTNGNYYIGASSSATPDLIFSKNAGAETMRITEAGNVGIGTTSPTGVLHLKAGTAAASTAPLKFTSGTNLTTAEAGAVEWDGTNLYITQTSGPTRKTIAYTDSAIVGTVPWDHLTNPGGNLSLTTMGSYTSTFTYGATTSTNNLFNLTDTASNTGTGYMLNVTTATGSALHPFRVAVNGTTEAIMVDANGNVGIGTTAPTTGSLVINRSGNLYNLDLIGATDGVTNFAVHGGSTNMLWTSRAGWFDIQTNTSGKGVNLQTNGGNLLLDGNGKVGIGTTSPTGNLSIVSPSSSDALVRIISANYATEYDSRLFLGENDTAGMTFEYDGVANMGYIGMNNMVDPTGSWSKRIQMYRDGTEVAFMAGNVGIGTAAPSARLHSYISSSAVTTSQYTSYLENLATNTTTDGINKYGMYITSTGAFTGGAGTATNNYGLYVNTPTGADNNYTIYSAGGYNYFAGSLGLGSQTYQNGGSAAEPGYSFSNDANTGFSNGQDDQIYISTGGTEKVRILSGGNVGIGTTNPASFKLQVAGSVGPNADATYDLGSSGVRWNNLYLANAPTVGGYHDLSNDNLLTNGDFETGTTTGWTGITSVVTGGYAGNYTSQTTNNSNNQTLSDDYIPVDPTKDVFQLEGWFKKTITGSPTPGLLYFGYIAYNSSKVAITSAPCNTYCYFAATNYTIPADSAWHKFSATTTGEGVSYPNFPVGTKYVRVLAYMNNTASSNETTQMDHVTLKRINYGSLFVGNNFSGTNMVDQNQVTNLYTTSGNNFIITPPSAGNVGIGNTSPTSRLVVKGSGTTSATSSLNVTNFSDTSLFYVRDDGNVGIGTTSPGVKLQVTDGSVYVNGENTSIYVDASNARLGFAKKTGDYPVIAAGSASPIKLGHWSTTGITPSEVGSGTFAANMTIDITGNVGIGTTSPTGVLHLKAGTAAASTAPLKFTSGTNLTTAEAGAVEWDGTNLYITQTSGPTRKTIAYTDSAIVGTVPWDHFTNPGGNLSLTTMGSYTSTFTYGATTSTNNLFNLTDTASNTGTGYMLNVTTATGSALHPFRVAVNGTTEAIMVDANGNVGIGTTGPNAQLVVNGITGAGGSINTGYSTNYKLQVGTETGDSGIMIRAGSTGVAKLSFDYGQNVDGLGRVWYNSSTNSLSLYTNAAEKMTILSTGNVGIGDTAPSQKLVVNGNIYTYNNVIVNDGYGLIDGGTNYQKVLVNSANGVIFSTGSGSTAERMRINTAGNVGIGIASPGTRLLNVTSSVASNDVAFEASILRTTGANYGVRALATGSGATTNYGIYAYATGATNNYAGIFEGGNVGIGTTNPTEKLIVGTDFGDLTSGTTFGVGDATANANIVVGQGVNNNLALRWIYNATPGSASARLNTAAYTNPLYIDASVLSLQSQSTGNVGIGTTNPASFKLQVAGSVGPNADATYDLGSSGARWNNLYLANAPTVGGYHDLSNDNLLTNGDFETGTVTGWSGLTTVTTGGYAGNYTSQTTASSTIVSDDYIPVDPTKDVLQLEGWFKKTVTGSPAAGILYFGYKAYNAGKTEITSAPCGTYCYFAAAASTIPADSAWHKYSATTTGEGTVYPNFPVGTKFVRVLVLINYGSSVNETTQMDHVTLKRINYGSLFVGNNFSGTNMVDQNQVTNLYTTVGNNFIITPPSNGNVGIGTTSPNAKLEIAGGSANSYIYIQSTGSSYDTGIQFTQLNGDTSGGTTSRQTWYQYIAATTGKFNIAQYYPATGINLQRLTIDTVGNVGIGTTAPGALLHVSGGLNGGTVDARGVIIDPTLSTTSVNWLNHTGLLVTPTFNTTSSLVTNAYGVKISPKHTGVYTTTNAYGLYVDTTTVTSGIVTNNYAAIFNGGNVGIGTTAPGYRLSVSSGDSSYAYFGPNASWSGKLLIGAGTNQGISQTAQIISTDGNLHIDPAPSKNMYIGYYQARDLYINPSGGNVGIGNSGPGYKLDVSGTLNATGAVTLGSTLGVTSLITASGGLTIAANQNLTMNTGTGRATIPRATIDRANNTASGINWYSTSYTAWSEYMGPAGTAGLGPSGTVTSPTGTFVTSWALRSFVENVGGYGWTWEAASAYSTTPTIVAELSSSTGNFKTSGTITTPGYVSITGAADTSGNLRFSAGNPYISAGSYFIAPGGAYFNSGTVYTEATLQARGGIGNDGGVLELNDDVNIGGGDLYVINSSGYVGVGTTSPVSKLNVAGNISLGTWVDYDTTGKRIGVPSSTGSWTAGDGNAFMNFKYVSTGGTGYNIEFFTHEVAASFGIRMTINPNGRVGIGRTAAANILEVEGNASKTAAGSWIANSDARIKTDISGIDNAVDVLNMLRPVKFKYTDEYMAQHPSLTSKYYYNFIAQEFQQVFPTEVTDSGELLPNGEHILALDPYVVTPYLVKAIQEQQSMISAQNSRIGALEANNLDTTSLIAKSRSEIFTSIQDLAINELVSIDPSSTSAVIIKTNTNDDKAVLGVVAEKVANTSDQYRVQYEGKAKVKVSVSKGEIKAGNLLTTSVDTPGAAVKSSDQTTFYLGIALESTTVDGAITVLFKSGYTPPAGTVGTLTPAQSQVLSLMSVDVQGKLVIKSDVEIQGKLKITNQDSKGSNVLVTEGQNFIQVNFAKPRENADYAITISPTWLTNTAITEKTTTGFKIEFGVIAPATAKIDWVIID